MATSETADLLRSAMQCHREGRLDEAVRLYQHLLAQQADHADALHGLGVVWHEQHDLARAVECIDRAWLLRPDDAIIRANLASAHNDLGISLRDQELWDNAQTHFRRAVELAPAFALAHSNLGLCLVDCRQPALGLPHCQEAVRVQPELAALHHNLGSALRSLGRSAEAQAAYREALSLDGDLAPAQAHLGLLLRQEGELGEALTRLQRAVELEPDNASYWESLAETHGEREEPTEAITCWERVLALAPDSAPAHLGLGWALQEESRLVEAGEHYRVAAKLQPASALAKLHLGRLHEELGVLAEAERCYRDALRLEPDFPLPHGQLATLLRGRMPDADRAALEARLADPHLPPGPRARLFFGLAHVRDAQADYAGATDCLQEANALTLQMQRGVSRYLPAEHDRFVDGMMSAFGPDFFARTAGVGLNTRRPVFIFGLPRSGTTLIEQVLASHAQVHGAGELALARRSFTAIPAALGLSASPIECISRLDAATIRSLAEQHDRKLAALAGNGITRVVDKMPDNYMYLGLLAAMFPDAVFIHCRRDLRDVAVSCWMTDFRSLRWANNKEHIARRFQQYCRLMEHWRAVLPVPMHEVDYEDAVADLDPVARGLVAACGLDWEPACLEFHRTQRPVRTASVVQVRQPVYQRSAGRWRHYETALADLLAKLPSPVG